jgi:hypothetical protein
VEVPVATTELHASITIKQKAKLSFSMEIYTWHSLVLVSIFNGASFLDFSTQVQMLN